jgi:hypothetical protein
MENQQAATQGLDVNLSRGASQKSQEGDYQIADF